MDVIKKKLLTADSVSLISHSDLGIKTTDVETGKPIYPKQLIINAQPNEKIIRQRQLLSDTSVQRLAGLVSRPLLGERAEIAKCFMPHHAILIFKKKKVSYIDICFGCRRIQSTSDIRFSEADFDEQKWTELMTYFLQKGLTYELIWETTPKDN